MDTGTRTWVLGPGPGNWDLGPGVGRDCVRTLTPKDSKGLTKELVSQVSASLRKVGCRCVLDDVKSGVRFKSMPIECFNRYEPLAQLDASNEAVSSSSNSYEQNNRVNVDVDLVGSKAKTVVGNKWERRLRVAT